MSAGFAKLVVEKLKGTVLCKSSEPPPFNSYHGGKCQINAIDDLMIDYRQSLYSYDMGVNIWCDQVVSELPVSSVRTLRNRFPGVLKDSQCSLDVSAFCSVLC